MQQRVRIMYNSKILLFFNVFIRFFLILYNLQFIPLKTIMYCYFNNEYILCIFYQTYYFWIYIDIINQLNNRETIVITYSHLKNVMIKKKLGF